LAWPALKLPALAALPLLALALLAEFALGMRHPFVDLGWLAWPVAVAAGFWLLHRLETTLPAPLLRLYHAGELWRLAFLLSWLSAYGIDELVRGAGTWPWISWALVPALLVVAISRPRPLPRWPLAAHRDTYLGWGAAPLVAALWL